MYKIRWLFTRGLDKVGITTVLAWCLLLIIVISIFIVLLPAQQKLKVLEQKKLMTPSARNIVYIEKDPSELFFSKIPHIANVTDSIRTVFENAKRSHITIYEVAYKDEKKFGEPVARYTMNFSVMATYPKIKEFVVNALASSPYLALERLTFERDKRNSNMATSHIQFTLYWVR